MKDKIESKGKEEKKVKEGLSFIKKFNNFWDFL
jgi:hypothetical protein